MGNHQILAERVLPPGAARARLRQAAEAARLRVAIVDDDDSIRFLIQTLLAREGVEAIAYGSAEALLADYRPDLAGCLLLDLQLPGRNGLELQEELIRRGNAIPIIFFTAQGSIAKAVHALKRGALDFIEKPFDHTVLLRKILDALERPAGPPAAGESESAAGRLALLTPREREVMDGVVAGHLNKHIADDLGICVKTVEFHRARIMQKTGVHSVAELVRLTVLSQGVPAPEGGYV